MQAIERRLQCMIALYYRTYVVRLDVRLPLGYVSMHANAECSKLMGFLKEDYTYNRISTHYVGVREQNTSDNPHYHLAIFFDGSNEDNGWAVFVKAAAIWRRIVGPGADVCVQLCQTFKGANGIKIVRPKAKSIGLDLNNNFTEFNSARREAMPWLSYLAKTATKGLAPPKTKGFFCSRLWN
ncbi:MAG: inovirus-type Gp2 protein [Chthoniobacter sp.]|nr:inovirus-type Gp2 protein [Chthoniobacter sp.]